MSTASWLTTADAEEQYGFPAKMFAAWCWEDKIGGARKEGRDWLMPAEGVAAFLQANPQLKSPDRSAAVQVPQRLWQAMAVVALILGLIADAYAVRDIIRGGDRTLLWIIAGILSAWLFVSALVILLSRRRQLVRWDGEKPVFTRVPRYRSRRLRTLAVASVVLMPAFLILGVVGYNVWRIIPPRQTVVLVADFLTSDGQDPNDVTEKLVKGMKDTLAGHPNITVKRLKRPITEEEGSNVARAIGNRPEHKAAFVIWGDYVLQPDPEVYVHFEILRQTRTYLGAGRSETYTPIQIVQPTMVEFKVNLAQHLSHLAAFASALSLHDAYRYKDAIPLFDTAAGAVDHPLGQDMQRAVRFYRGTNYLSMGRARDAEPDLRSLVADLLSDPQASDYGALAALNNLGVVAWSQGDYAAARQYYQQALDISTQLGDPSGRAAALGNLGNVAGRQGDYAAARQYYQQALDISTQFGDPGGEANTLNNLGIVAWSQGDSAAARQYCQQALDRFIQLGDPSGQADALCNLGNVAGRQGDYASARQYYQQALDISTQLGDPSGRAAALGNLGNVAGRQGDYATARQYYQQALDISTQFGDPGGEANALNSLGIVAWSQGDSAAARQYCQQALDRFTQLGNHSGQAAALGNLGNVALGQGDYAAARQYYQQALDRFTQLGDPSGQVTTLNNLGNVASGQGDYAAARQYYQQALDISTEVGDPSGQALAMSNLGILSASQGDLEAAKAYLERSVQLYRKLGVPIPNAVQSALDSLPAP
jgi:tetratricopeptide (TPR) repeat protein